MTQLALRVNQRFAYGYLEAGALVTVRLLADARGNVTREWWTGREAIDVTGDQSGPRGEVVFDVPMAGHYGITITRPRATDVEREVLVGDGERHEETIILEASPHEYLGWQQFAGIVSPDTTFPDGGVQPKLVPTQPSVSPIAITNPRAAWDPGSLRNVRPTAPPPDWPMQSDWQFATWFPRLPDAYDSSALIDDLRQSQPHFFIGQHYPRWVIVEANGARELASIPWAWWGPVRNGSEGLRIVYSRAEVDVQRAGHTVVTVLDTRWFALLEFLASNRLGEAAELAEGVLKGDGPWSAQQALEGKLKGPLVAAAGALVLVARNERQEQALWDTWLQNLSNWFPGIPDGPILLGYRRLSQARSGEDLEGAYALLQEGIARGVPYFSASMLLLMQALAQLANDLPQAESERRFVSGISCRVDPNQPFTVLRL